MAQEDFEINGVQFKLRKIDALKQFHIARRISPILADLMPALSQMAKVDKNKALSEEDRLAQFAQLAEPLFKGFAKLSDEESDKLLNGLLTAVEMKQPAGNWAKLSNGSMLMFSDLDLAVLLNAAGRAFAFNMQGFFSALQRGS